MAWRTGKIRATWYLPDGVKSDVKTWCKVKGKGLVALQKLDVERRLDKRLINADIFSALAGKARRDILFALSIQNLSYISIGTMTKIYRTQIAYHIKFLKKFHLISHDKFSNVYYLTVRGCRIVELMKEIENSEMFIVDV